MKIALALIVKGSDGEAKILEECLRSVSPYVDGIFITTTYKDNESETDSVDKLAKEYKANISHYKWEYDFSKARNFNFKQVTKEYDYILWCDADDIFRGLHKLKNTIKENPADAYQLFYMYSFDENNNPLVVHQKSQIVKNDGCVKWIGELHEDFDPTRQLETYFINGIERIHISHDERFEEAKKRNLEIAKRQREENPDDPRARWNVGNSLKALGKNEEALKEFSEFLKTSQSDDEKYIVRLRRAECLWLMGRKNDAIDECRYAIGLKPDFPDAYNTAGALFLEVDKFEDALKMFAQGLSKKPPYHEIIVYNPRDYDYTPMMNMAKAYFGLQMPMQALILLEACLKIYPDDKGLKNTVKKMKKESDRFEKMMHAVKKLKEIKDNKKLAEEIDNLPTEIRSHPMVCNIRNTRLKKEKSSGKDLVFFCGYTEKQWDPEVAKEKGVGGSEEAVIHLTEGLSKDWNVTVYNNCGHKEKKFGKVTYKPYWSWNYRDKQDAVILWRSPVMAKHDINTDLLVIDLHDVVEPGEFNKERLAKIDKIFVKSEFHKSLFPNIPEEKFVVVPNGIKSEEFEGQHIKDKNLIINTSSPDRSLSALIKGFKKVKEQVPDARCQWAYGWKIFDIVHGDNPKIMDWKDDMKKQIKEAGIEELGMVSHDMVAEMYKNAQVFGYPSEFAEIDCISLTKAIASGAYPVTSDFAAMGEKAKYGGHYIKTDKTANTWCKPYQNDFSLDHDLDEWVQATVRALGGIGKLERDKILKDFNWDNVTKIWNNTLKGSLK